MEALISINNHLRQPEAAIGILTKAQQDLHMELKESWYEKLQRWEEALEAYERKYAASPPASPAHLEATLGRMRCASRHSHGIACSVGKTGASLHGVLARACRGRADAYAMRILVPLALQTHAGIVRRQSFALNERHGRRCLAALAEWEQLGRLCRGEWRRVEPHVRRDMAALAAHAAWHLGEWCAPTALT